MNTKYNTHIQIIFILLSINNFYYFESNFINFSSNLYYTIIALYVGILSKNMQEGILHIVQVCKNKTFLYSNKII